VSVLYVVLGLVALQRLVELLYAQRNTRRLLARGGTETASWQHLFFVTMHAAWIVAMAVLVPPNTAPNWYLLGLYVVLQGLRFWAIASLGPYWTTRIITLPGAPIVRSGPYRWVRHPNYIVVVAEIAVLPLAFGATSIALIFSALNAGLLALRIRAEEAALSGRYSL
jgi:methyltransferase